MENKKIFDLATGEQCRYPFEAPDTFTYDPEADCPRWDQFLNEITCGDTALEVYIKRMVGYCMTDSTVEQVMFMLLGDGCNGKSTFVNVIQQLLGDYARCCQTRLLFGKRGAACDDTLLSRLQNCRLVVLGEPNQNEKLCASAVKQLVNDGNQIVARELYGKAFEYTQRFKILVTTNHLPKIEADIPQTIKRIKLIPFSASFCDVKDANLHKNLNCELSGIFNWALEGAAEWCEHGLPTEVEGDYEV